MVDPVAHIVSVSDRQRKRFEDRGLEHQSELLSRIIPRQVEDIGEYERVDGYVEEGEFPKWWTGWH